MTVVTKCQHCRCLLDELTLCMEGPKAAYCSSCRHSYAEQTEEIPEGLRIWEENALGEKRNEHLWWRGHVDRNCDRGFWKETSGPSWSRKTTTKQCWLCDRVYSHGLLENPFRHQSGAWVFSGAHKVWFPDCTCYGGQKMEHHWRTNEVFFKRCDLCSRRFDQWVQANDQANVRYTIRSLKTYTEWRVKVNKQTNERKAYETTIQPKWVMVSALYRFPDGHQRTLLLYDWEPKGEWEHSFGKRSFQENHADAEAYVLEKQGAAIRHFWS